MKRRRRKDNDPFHDIREWQDHMYDPGYFTGGRIDPLLEGRRPNAYGWVLIATGLLGLFLVVPSSGPTWPDGFPL